MENNLNYKKLFWLVHVTGWIAFILFDFYINFDQFGNGKLNVYWLASVTNLFLLLPVARIFLKKIAINEFFSLNNLMKLIGVILTVGFCRKLLDIMLYLAFSLDSEAFASLLHQIYVDQIVTFNLLKGVIQLSVPVFFWVVLYFGIKFWFHLSLERQKNEKVLLMARDAQLKMLRYQLNPHFLFNSLNSVQALIHENPDLADKVLTELSDFLRYTLKNSNRILIPLKEEIEAIKQYLGLEKIRFEEKLMFDIEITEEASKRMVPGFLFQPLIENAIKYGIKTSPLPLSLFIKAYAEEDRLIIEITNTGHWIENKNPGTGLVNVKSRLEEMFGNAYSLDTMKHDDRVCIAISMKKMKQA